MIPIKISPKVEGKAWPWMRGEDSCDGPDGGGGGGVRG